VHTIDERINRIIRSALALAENRLRLDPVPLDRGTRSAEELQGLLGGLISEEGRDSDEVLGIYTSIIAPTVISANSPRFLGFIPAAPTKASLLFDMLVSCASIQGISWLEASGVIAAENQVLRLIADQAGLPAGAGGCFVSGGTAGNLSAIAVAREVAKRREGAATPGWPLRIVVGSDAHSSITNTLRLLEMDALVVSTPDHRFTAEALQAALDAEDDLSDVAAVVCTSGTTNAGIVTISPGSVRSPRTAARGSTWTGPTAEPGSRPVCATSTPASSGPTRSSSTRTNGCSRRSTPARCSTGSRRWPAPSTPRMRPTWT